MKLSKRTIFLTTAVVAVNLSFDVIANEEDLTGDDVLSKVEPKEEDHPWRIKFEGTPHNAWGKYQQYYISPLWISGEKEYMDQDGGDIRIDPYSSESVRVTFQRMPEPKDSDYFYIMNVANLHYLRFADNFKVSFSDIATVDEKQFQWKVEKRGDNYRLQNRYSEGYVTWLTDHEIDHHQVGLVNIGENFDRVLWNLEYNRQDGSATVDGYSAKLYGAEINEQELTGLDTFTDTKVSVTNTTNQEGTAVLSVTSGGSTGFSFSNTESWSNTIVNSHTVSRSLTTGFEAGEGSLKTNGAVTTGYSWTGSTERTNGKSVTTTDSHTQTYNITGEVRHNYDSQSSVKIYATGRRAKMKYAFSGFAVKQYDDGNLSLPQEIDEVVDGVFVTDFQFKVVDTRNSVKNPTSLSLENAILKNRWMDSSEIRHYDIEQLRNTTIHFLDKYTESTVSELQQLDNDGLTKAGYLYHWVVFGNIISGNERATLKVNQMRNVVEDYLMIQTKKTAVNVIGLDTFDLLKNVFELYSTDYDLKSFFVYPALVDAGDVIALLDWEENSLIPTIDQPMALRDGLHEYTKTLYIELKDKTTKQLIGDALLYYGLLKNGIHTDENLKEMGVDGIRNSVISIIDNSSFEYITSELQSKNNYELARLYFDPKGF